MSEWKKQRREELRQAQEAEVPYFDEAYPRLKDSEEFGPVRKTVADFITDFHERLVDEEVIVMGRIRAKRIAGKGLIFIDIVNEFQKVQIMLNKRKMTPDSSCRALKFTLFRNLMQVGDHICEYLTCISDVQTASC